MALFISMFFLCGIRMFFRNSFPYREQDDRNLTCIRRFCILFDIPLPDRKRSSAIIGNHEIFQSEQPGTFAFSGLVWITAGANVLRVGIEAWRSGGPSWPFGAAAAVAVFLLFYLFVFKRLYFRHANRIESKEGRSCPFSFFDIKGWIVMGAMIAFGAAARSFGLLSDSFVSVFYIGLSSALIVTGIRFLYRWKRFRRP